MQISRPSISVFVLGMFSGATLSLALTSVAVETPAFPFSIEQFRLFSTVTSTLRTNYVDPIDDKRLMNECIKGMVSGIDSESAYLDQEDAAELFAKVKKDTAGTGLEIAKNGDFVTVISPIDDTPAYREGVKSGDLITKIDGADIKGLSLSKVIERLRGKENTQVSLTIVRSGADNPVLISIMREPIKVESVKSGWVEPGFAYIRLSRFQEDTAAKMAKHLKVLFRQGPVSGLVLDLRDNPGGLFASAIAVSAAYLPPNSLIVSTNGRAEYAKASYRATRQDYQSSYGVDDLKDLPLAVKTVRMVVLINGGSAAASEIVAGALQDHKRATIAGTPTFGRASIQTLLPFEKDAILKLTTARWLTPGGKSVHGKGLVPDIPFSEGKDQLRRQTISDSQVKEAVEVLKRAPAGLQN